ncbi:MAG: hypothetical protein ACKO0Z_04240 [Betaproteobacteria bacterium]
MELEEILTEIYLIDHQMFPLFADAVKIFDEFNSTAYIDEFRLILNTHPDATDSERMGILVNTLHDMLIELVSMHLIMLSADATIRDAIDLLDCLIHLQHTDNVTQCLDIIAKELSPEETLIELFECAKFESHDHMLRAITRVDDALINRIKQVLSDRLLVMDVNEPSQKEISAQVKFYIALRKLVAGAGTAVVPHMIGDTLIMNESQIGLDLEFYLNSYREHFKKRLMSRTPEDMNQVLYDVASLICISKDSATGALSRIGEITDSVYPDLDGRKYLSSKLRELIGRINHG